MMLISPWTSRKVYFRAFYPNIVIVDNFARRPLALRTIKPHGWEDADSIVGEHVSLSLVISNPSASQ